MTVEEQQERQIQQQQQQTKHRLSISTEDIVDATSQEQRRCAICDRTEKELAARSSPSVQQWYTDKMDPSQKVCARCYKSVYSPSTGRYFEDKSSASNNNNKAASISRTIGRVCVDCGTTKTQLTRHRKSNGEQVAHPSWYRVAPNSDDEWLCQTCYYKRRREAVRDAVKKGDPNVRIHQVALAKRQKVTEELLSQREKETYEHLPQRQAVSDPQDIYKFGPKQVTCICCGSEEAYKNARHNAKDTADISIDYYKCNECGFGFAPMNRTKHFVMQTDKVLFLMEEYFKNPRMTKQTLAEIVERKFNIPTTPHLMGDAIGIYLFAMTRYLQDYLDLKNAAARNVDPSIYLRARKDMQFCFQQVLTPDIRYEIAKSLPTELDRRAVERHRSLGECLVQRYHRKAEKLEKKRTMEVFRQKYNNIPSLPTVAATDSANNNNNDNVQDRAATALAFAGEYNPGDDELLQEKSQLETRLAELMEQEEKVSRNQLQAQANFKFYTKKLLEAKNEDNLYQAIGHKIRGEIQFLEIRLTFLKQYSDIMVRTPPAVPAPSPVKQSSEQQQEQEEEQQEEEPFIEISAENSNIDQLPELANSEGTGTMQQQEQEQQQQEEKQQQPEISEQQSPNP